MTDDADFYENWMTMTFLWSWSWWQYDDNDDDDDIIILLLIKNSHLYNDYSIFINDSDLMYYTGIL